VTVLEPDDSIASESSVDWYAAARPLCLARLTESLDPLTGLFSRQMRGGRWGDTGKAEATTSTAICLVALSRAGVDSSELGLDQNRSLDSLAQSVRKHPGALGLAIWANAVHDGRDFASFLDLCGHADERPHGLIPNLTTMELAWLLSGLLHEQRRSTRSGLSELIDATIAALLRRQTASGLFSHAEHRASFADRLRRHVATFADEIYPVQALAFAMVGRGRQDARDAARRAADALLERRGPLHQWWWHYNIGDGSVSRHYPVFSVHQYGMAPMAFLTLAAAGAKEYRDRAQTGLNWLQENELDQQMLDAEAGTIWRDIHVENGAFVKRLRDVSEVIGLSGDRRSDPSRLRLNWETRPYEWGWCLMAGALLTAAPPHRHLA
jgi:hypothetical protein